MKLRRSGAAWRSFSFFWGSLRYLWKHSGVHTWSSAPCLPWFISHTFFSHLSSFAICSRWLFSVSLACSLFNLAGSEHFLLGENLTVAVLGVVIPIGKSPVLFPSVCPSRVKAGGAVWSCCLSCVPSTLTLCCQNHEEALAHRSPSPPAASTFITHLAPCCCVGFHCKQCSLKITRQSAAHM